MWECKNETHVEPTQFCYLLFGLVIGITMWVGSHMEDWCLDWGYHVQHILIRATIRGKKDALIGKSTYATPWPIIANAFNGP